MTDNSDNSEQLPKNQEELPEPSEELPKKPDVAEEAAPPLPAPKCRGRPRGSRDSAPRVRRVPVVAPAPNVRAASRPPRQVRVREPEPDSELDEAAPLPVAELQEAPEPAPPKSPRTLRKEHMQALANHRRAAQQAQQARFDRLLDGFMGY